MMIGEKDGVGGLPVLDQSFSLSTKKKNLKSIAGTNEIGLRCANGRTYLFILTLLVTAQILLRVDDQSLSAGQALFE